MPKSREYVKKRGNKPTNETQTTRSRFNFGTASYILSERLSLHAVYYTPQGSRRTTLYLGMGEPQNQDARVHYALGVEITFRRTNPWDFLCNGIFANVICFWTQTTVKSALSPARDDILSTYGCAQNPHCHFRE